MTIVTGQINVTVATVWTDVSSPRPIDQESLQHPVQIDSWLNRLSAEERKTLLDANKVQSQILYGEIVYIIEEKEDWAHVVIPAQASIKDKRGYPGWIPLAQITKVEPEDLESLDYHPIAVVKDKITGLLDESGKEIIPLSYNTILPVLAEQDDKGFIEVLTPHGQAVLRKSAIHMYSSTDSIPQNDGQDIINEAVRFQGLEYLWGGMSAYGYDCSGFTYNMLKANGYIIPRDATDQSKRGLQIDKKHVQPGDLLFFAYEEGKGRLHHVGIYYGDGKMIHSPTPGKKIMVQTIAGSFYEKEWIETRRYWHEKGQ